MLTTSSRPTFPEGQECYDTACDLAENGCNIIFADSFGHEPFMIDAAKKYPDVQFCPPPVPALTPRRV